MEKTLNPLYSVPVAVLVGCFIIVIAILMHGGIIKVGAPSGSAAVQPTPQAGSPSAPKGADQIIENLKVQATTLGLDQDKFNSCVDSGSKAADVQKDLDDGTKAGVNGTPAFFVNGRLISGAVPFSEFKKVIDEELSGSTSTGVNKQNVEVGNLPPLGNQNAPVTLIEFSDYECPFCERHFSQAETQIMKEYVDAGKVKFYYRDFPLSSIHPGAQKAAEAARCAGDQGKYWQYHDLLFQNQANIF